MRLGAIALALLLGTACAAPRPSPAQAYEQGKKAGVAAYIPPPSTADEQRHPARYYRTLKSDARTSADRYYVGSAWHWESRNFRQGFVDGLMENLEARALKADAAVRGTADDYALGRKMALDLARSHPDAEFKALPARHPKDTRLHLILAAETWYRTAYVEAGKGAKPWDGQSAQFRTGFVDGFHELCGADQVDKDSERARRTPADDFVLGLLAGRKAAAAVDADERAAMVAGTEDEQAAIIAKHYKAGGSYDPAKESDKFQEGYATGFREACGLKD